MGGTRGGSRGRGRGSDRGVGVGVGAGPGAGVRAGPGAGVGTRRALIPQQGLCSRTKSGIEARGISFVHVEQT